VQQIDLVAEFSTYIKDVFENAPPESRDKKLETILARLEDSSVRKAGLKMLDLDVDCSDWTDKELAEKLLNHTIYRSSKGNMMPSHCMMIEAARRLLRGG
jgi:hypothetical protein